MESLPLPAADIAISRIVFGCDPLGGVDWGAVDVGAASAAVQLAVELSVTAFDTADAYGLGESERVLGNALGAQARRVVVMSKVGVNWRPANGGRAATFADLSGAHIEAALDASLRRLRLECIPLYFMHRPDPRTPIEETLESLDRCRSAGKILAIGACNFPPALLQRTHQLMPLTAVQAQYSLLDRRAEIDVLPLCHRLGIPFLAYGPLGQGLLTGKFTAQAQFGEGDRRHRLPHFSADRLESGLALARTCRTVGERMGRTASQVAIRWLLDQPGVGGAIVGAKTSAQVTENVGAVGWKLDDKSLALLAAAAESASGGLS